MKSLRLSSQELFVKTDIMQKRNRSKVKKAVLSYFFGFLILISGFFTRVVFGEKHIEYRTEMPIGRLSCEFLFIGSFNESKNRVFQGRDLLEDVVFVRHWECVLLMLAFVRASL